jgi:deoxycytidylate deaminase
VTCAKLVVTCEIVPRGVEGAVIGTNGCDNPQSVCPRLPGEGYTKCESVCMQDGHAEMQALRRARALDVPLRGATAYITGHYHVCEPCARALRAAGIAKIVIEVTPP